MLEINEGELLTRVSRYELYREAEGRLFIDVHEIVAGKTRSKYTAVPNLLVSCADYEMRGFGQTEREALEDCLRKIKSLSIFEIMPDQEIQAAGNGNGNRTVDGEEGIAGDRDPGGLENAESFRE